MSEEIKKELELLSKQISGMQAKTGDARYWSRYASERIAEAEAIKDNSEALLWLVRKRCEKSV